MMTFAEKVYQFKKNLQPDWQLPEGFELLFPYHRPDTQMVMEAFLNKFYGDQQLRIPLFSINPGRFGSGITGVGFTDPIRLENDCEIPNDFAKKPELSSDFIYRMIQAYGGPKEFYQLFYFISVCPLGFVKDGKNINYYDDPKLQEAVSDKILNNINTQIAFGCTQKVAVVIGQGKNYKYLERLNREHNFFEELLVLPHPRWVMQYRRKKLDHFISEYLKVLELASAKAALYLCFLLEKHFKK